MTGVHLFKGTKSRPGQLVQAAVLMLADEVCVCVRRGHLLHGQALPPNPHAPIDLYKPAGAVMRGWVCKCKATSISQILQAGRHHSPYLPNLQQASSPLKHGGNAADQLGEGCREHHLVA